VAAFLYRGQRGSTGGDARADAAVPADARRTPASNAISLLALPESWHLVSRSSTVVVKLGMHHAYAKDGISFFVAASHFLDQATTKQASHFL